MLSFPLIARELRIQSRKRATYDLRAFIALGVLVIIWLFVSQFPQHTTNGTHLFTLIHFVLALLLFIIAPIGAADSISREKREGTLGLLLLTELTPMQIVLGKIAAHLIRVTYFAVTILPFTIIPVLMGGVEPKDFLFSIIILITIAAVGLSAGLIASALCLNFAAAIAWAIIFAALLTLVAGGSVINILLVQFPTGSLGDMPGFFRYFFALGPLTMLFPMQVPDIAGRFIASRSAVPMIEVGFILFSIIFLRCSLVFCARQIARHAELAGETKRRAAFRRTFLTPFLLRNSFRRSMSRKLDRNPLLWLEYRTPWARAARWTIACLILGIEIRMLIDLPNRQEFIGVQAILLWALLLFLTLKSSSAFQNEKETGAFELILVTPLTETKLFTARLIAVASYYALPLVMLAACALIGLYGTEPSPYAEPDRLIPAMNLTSLCASFISVPICGFYFAIYCRGFMPALFSTAGLAILLPLCIWMAFSGLIWMGATRVQPPIDLALRLQNTLQTTWWPALSAMTLYHLTVATLCARATIHILRARHFSASSKPI
ncbi:MAG TPA: ABC transporter permease subunit [Verrucomicrobiae bacterium]|nr:ABC transporter permease subunit [Verrucomicrobiae bacterium]